MLNNNVVTIGIVAGEASGDILGSGLMCMLKKRLNNVFFFGIGGSFMKLEHMESWYDISELSVMGMVEVFFKLPRLLRIRKDLANRFLNLKPDVFIGIDSPDFNIPLEKCLKVNGIPTIHYVSPSVWAWRSKRIFKLKEATNNILLLLPFEKKIYDKFDIPCQFVGHTLADKIPINPDKNFVRKKLGIAQDKICLALCPGSRIKEVETLAYYFLKSAELLTQRFPGLEVLISLVNKNFESYLSKATSVNFKFRIFDNQDTWEIMMAADVSLLASGTVTLECMLAKCPMVVAYRMHPLTFFLIKLLIKVPWISLPNLLAKRNLVKEFIQKECNVENLTEALINLLCNDNERKKLIKVFCQLHYTIRCNADERAANAVLELIKK